MNWRCGQRIRQEICSRFVPTIERFFPNDWQFGGNYFCEAKRRRNLIPFHALSFMVRECSLTFQYSGHNSRIPQVGDANQKESNILYRFARIRTRITVQQPNQGRTQNV